MEDMDQFMQRWDGENTDELKEWILTQVGEGRTAAFIGKATYEIDGVKIHVRQTWAATGETYPFNINPNTLKADYELWILGWSLWYLIPIEAIRYMYESPSAYRDSHHPEIVAVSVNEEREEVRFARDEPPLCIAKYRHATLARLRAMQAV